MKKVTGTAIRFLASVFIAVPTPPYIRRMAEDKQVRNLAPSTIDSYTYPVDKFCHFFGTSAEQLGRDPSRGEIVASPNPFFAMTNEPGQTTIDRHNLPSRSDRC